MLRWCIMRKTKRNINKLLNKRASEFVDIKDKIDLNKLIYNFKTEGKIPKEFRNFQTPLKLY